MPDIRALLRKVDQMPHGSAKVEAARELWNLASQDEDASLRFDVLCETLEAAVFGGASDYFLALIPQMVRIKRDHPEAIDPFVYVWRLKWLATDIVDYPEVPMARIRQGEAEYERELRNIGGSERTAIFVRWKNAIHTGNFEGAEQLREEFLGMRRDQHADCFACEAQSLVRDALFRDDHSEAVKRASGILSGRTRCAEIPHLTLAHLSLSAELNGESEKATAYHQKGYRLVRSNIKFVAEVGLHMAYLASCGEVERALRILKTHVAWLEQNRTPIAHYHFLLGAAATCEALAKKRKRALKLPLPAKWLAAWGDKPLALAELAERFEHEGRALAGAFDRRNENAWHGQNFDQTLARIRERRSSRPVAVGQEGSGPS
jgi:hypothetical protein